MFENNTQITKLLLLWSLVVLVILSSVESFQAVNNVLASRRTGQMSETTLFVVPTPDREPTTIEENVWEEDDDDEYDELVDGLTQKLEAMEGLWYSDDFYSKDGREWVNLSAHLVGASATSALLAVKVTGDPNVPAGCVTWQTSSWPTEGGPGVSAEIQIRANPDDPDGFSWWLPGELSLINENQIQLTCRFTANSSGVGTFHQKQDDSHIGSELD